MGTTPAILISSFSLLLYTSLRLQFLSVCLVTRLLLDSGASYCLPDSNGQLLTCAEFAGIQFILETYRRERIGVICGALERAASLEEFQTIWQVEGGGTVCIGG